MARCAQGLAEACLGRWTSLEADPPQPRHATLLLRTAPRIAIAAALLATAWVIPDVLWKSLDQGAQTTLQVTLTISAVTALLTPANALSSAASTPATFGSKGK